jgi:arylsulfatase
VIDVVPTILQACQIAEPKLVNGIPQKPIEGVSMLYSFDNATAPGQRQTQYFELATNRAIYHDGWLACSRYGLPWITAGRDDGFLNAPWELYNVNEDFSQANNLAERQPAKLKELQEKFLEEAKKYGVFPLDPRFSERFDPTIRAAGEPKTKWTYYGNVWLPEPIGPQLFPRPHRITAELEIPHAGANGVIACVGAFSAGWSLYVKDGKPSFRYTCFEIADITISGRDTLPTGTVTVKTEFLPDGSREGGGSLKLIVNDKTVGEGKIKRSLFRHGLEPFEVGRDSITAVAPDYKTPFEFTGKVNRIDFELIKK